MSLETASLPLQPHILDSWDDGPAVGTTTQQLDLQQQQQQAGQSVRGKLGLTQQFCGLYPVLSGVESPPQLQQHQQSPGSKAEVRAFVSNLPEPLMRAPAAECQQQCNELCNVQCK